MIQRVQSIWLLLAVITLVAMFFLPLLSKTVNATEYSVYASGLRQETESKSGSGLVAEIAILPITLSIGALLLCLVAIFLYRNRRLQKGTIMTAIAAIAAMTGLSVFSADQIAGHLPGGIPGGLADMNITAGTFLPVVAVILCILALRGIRNDEQLLRSADRLR